MKKLNICIVNTLAIPSGAAAVNRILSYSKGLVELGNDVTILSSGKGDNKYHNLYGVKYKNFRKIENSTFNLFSFVPVLFRLIKTICKMKLDIVILVSNSLFLIYPLAIICSLLKIKLIQEKSEYPFVLRNKSFLGRIYSSFYINTTYKLFDGILAITDILNSYFSSKINKHAKIITVPMMVDSSRFKIGKSSNEFGDYIAYCGDMTGNKDGIFDLIDAFKLISSDFSDLKLLLIGGTSDSYQLSQIHNKISDCPKIILTGRVSREEIPKLLSNSKLLVLARPSSLQSTGGFPTKLGEYLATGNPVLVTSVGEIPLYLKDGKNAFLSPPDDVKSFAEKIKFILLNYNFALSVGKEGLKLTQDIFNYKVQSKRLYSFFNTLLK